MKAVDSLFRKIIQGSTQFIVPVFQRDYSWTEDHCERLWDDVLNTAKAPSDQLHFIGSVVYIDAEGDASMSKWLLIDGQQRLTTLMLLLIAIRNHIKVSNWEGSSDGPTVRKIENGYLKNSDEEGDRRYKLVLRGNDDSHLRALLDDGDLNQLVSNRIFENYDWFIGKITDENVEELYRGINKLAVVDVTLHRLIDNPQLIFESLNSTGLDLSESDLIRNFVLMGQTESKQDEFYGKYWKVIESLFRDSESMLDLFFRDFIALEFKTSKQVKAKEIYSTFRNRFGMNVADTTYLENLLRKIVRYARYHAAFSVGAGNKVHGELELQFARLRKLVDVPAMLIMRLYDCYDKEDNTLSEVEFVELIKLIESYIVRRAVCGLQTRGYWFEFAKIAYRISETDPVNSLNGNFALIAESYAFPKNSEFKNELTGSDLYGKRICRHILDSLENHNTKEPSPTTDYSVEHILPQNTELGVSWRNMLGENYKQIQSEFVHRLGNLTLTGYNSTYSDRSFQEKKTIENGFNSSAVRLNKFVCNQDKWTSVEIEERGELLGEKALKIWPSLNATKEQIEVARTIELKRRQAQKDVSKIQMSEIARNFFNALSERVKEIDPGIFELAENRSVSYHNPQFFLEVLPRKDRLLLLLAIDFNEVQDDTEFIHNSDEWKFFVSAAYSGGSYCNVSSEIHINEALPFIRVAYSHVKT